MEYKYNNKNCPEKRNHRQLKIGESCLMCGRPAWNRNKGNISPELYIALFNGFTAKQLIERGYKAGKVYGYSRRMKKMRKDYEERILNFKRKRD